MIKEKDLNENSRITKVLIYMLRHKKSNENASLNSLLLKGSSNFKIPQQIVLMFIRSNFFRIKPCYKKKSTDALEALISISLFQENKEEFLYFFKKLRINKDDKMIEPYKNSSISFLFWINHGLYLSLSNPLLVKLFSVRKKKKKKKKKIKKMFSEIFRKIDSELSQIPIAPLVNYLNIIILKISKDKNLTIHEAMDDVHIIDGDCFLNYHIRNSSYFTVLIEMQISNSIKEVHGFEDKRDLFVKHVHDVKIEFFPKGDKWYKYRIEILRQLINDLVFDSVDQFFMLD